MPEQESFIELEKSMEELRDLAYELGRVDFTLMVNGCYIGKKLFGIDMPDDFKNYGKLFLMSDLLQNRIHLLDMRLMTDEMDKEPLETEKEYSTLRKLGAVIRNYPKDDIRLAAVYLMRSHIPNNFSEEEKSKAETIIEDIRKKGQSYFSAV